MPKAKKKPTPRKRAAKKAATPPAPFLCWWDGNDISDAKPSMRTDFEAAAEEFVEEHLNEAGGGDYHLVQVRRSTDGLIRRMRVSASVLCSAVRA